MEDVVSSRALLLLTLLSTSAAAQSSSIEGWGRITAGGGWRWVPNWYFADKAAQAGFPYVKSSPGGPQGFASFGYGVVSYLEVAIDLFAGAEWFEISGYSPFTAVTYGAVLGPRLSIVDFPFKGLIPHLGVQVGPTLAMLQTDTVSIPEKVLMGTSINGGFTWRFADRFGLTFDARWIFARGYVPPISGINVGGAWFSLGFTIYFPPAPKRDLDVPGF